MFEFVINTAARNIRTEPSLTVLMTLAIGLGIGFFMTILTVGYSMGKNPLPDKNDLLYRVQLDSGNPTNVPEDSDDLPNQLTHIDAMELMRLRSARRQVASAGASAVVVPEEPTLGSFQARMRKTFTDFFAMFEAHFAFGSGWSSEDDVAKNQVVVLSHALNDKLFVSVDSVGRTISIGDDLYQIVGVLQPWRPTPRIYDLTGDPFEPPADMFLPFNTMALQQYDRRGNVSCWKPLDGNEFETFLDSECVWIQFWVELRDLTEKAQYLDFLNNYVTEQKRLGLFWTSIEQSLAQS